MELNMLALPLATQFLSPQMFFFSFSYKGKIQLLKKIIEVCDEWGVNRIIFGMPYNIDGTKNKMCKEIEKFSKKLALELSLIHI